MEYRPEGMDQALDPAATLLPTHMEVGTSAPAGATTGDRVRQAAADVAGGIGLWRLGLTLGWLDIKLRYRGSMLGPFWLTISTAVWIGAMGALYGLLFHQDLHGYLPFLALSLVLWTALGGLVGDGCNTFLQSEGTIRSMRMPFFVYAIRVVVRTVIALAHNIPVVVVVFALFGAWPGARALWCVPGFMLWTVDAFAVCIALGSLCARFRDVPPIVASVMQIAFFITPIMWQPQQLGAHNWWLKLNPFDDLLEVVRQPLLGALPNLHMWEAALAFSAGFCVLTGMLFVRVRGRLAFWM
jgi:lipopolysaccharide transport system permease protein